MLRFVRNNYSPLQCHTVCYLTCSCRAASESVYILRPTPLFSSAIFSRKSKLTSIPKPRQQSGNFLPMASFTFLWIFSRLVSPGDSEIAFHCVCVPVRVCVHVCAVPVVGSPSVSSIRREAEPSRGFRFSMAMPSNTAALMSVAKKRRERTTHLCISSYCH